MRFRSLTEITQKYNTVVIDPPWPISLAGQFEGKSHRPMEMAYHTMSLEEIARMGINRITNPGGHIYLWTTNKFLKEAFTILERWGIKYHITLVMVKPSGMAPSLGYVFGAEYCLMGYRPPMKPFSKGGALNWFKNQNNHGEHSRKPDAFYKIVELTSPGPRIDLFSRRLRAGWDVMGDELGFAQVELS